jgi:hypothetical protein
MRRLLMLTAAVALVATACSSGTTSAGGLVGLTPTVAHAGRMLHEGARGRPRVAGSER